MKLHDDHLRQRLPPPTGEWRSRDGLRDAAVLLALLDRGGEDHVVFQQRRDDLPTHPGQIAFPGGSRDPGEDAAACALRETHEEVGISATDITLLGRLPERVSVAGHLVSPFVGRLAGPRPYVIDAREVVEAFEIPLAPFTESARWSWRPATVARAGISRVPYFEWEGRVVWGLTAIFMRDFLRIVDDRL